MKQSLSFVDNRISISIDPEPLSPEELIETILELRESVKEEQMYCFQDEKNCKSAAQELEYYEAQARVRHVIVR